MVQKTSTMNFISLLKRALFGAKSSRMSPESPESPTSPQHSFSEHENEDTTGSCRVLAFDEVLENHEKPAHALTIQPGHSNRVLAFDEVSVHDNYATNTVQPQYSSSNTITSIFSPTRVEARDDDGVWDVKAPGDDSDDDLEEAQVSQAHQFAAIKADVFATTDTSANITQPRATLPLLMIPTLSLPAEVCRGEAMEASRTESGNVLEHGTLEEELGERPEDSPAPTPSKAESTFIEAFGAPESAALPGLPKEHASRRAQELDLAELGAPVSFVFSGASLVERPSNGSASVGSVQKAKKPEKGGNSKTAPIVVLSEVRVKHPTALSDVKNLIPGSEGSLLRKPFTPAWHAVTTTPEMKSTHVSRKGSDLAMTDISDSFE